MIRKRFGKAETEGLLRQALKDDMPPKAEQLLRRELQVLWQKAQLSRQVASTVERKPDGTGLAAGAAWAWVHGSKRKAAVALASLTLLITGAAMQMAHKPSPLVESLWLRQTSTLVLDRVRRSGGMECEVESVDEKGRALRYTIHWLPSGQIQVCIRHPEGTALRTLRMPSEDVSLVTARTVGAGVRQTQDLLSDPLLHPVRDFLTPSALALAMAGTWRAESGIPPGIADSAFFSIRSLWTPARMEVTVDRRSHLPIRITAFHPVPAGTGAAEIQSRAYFRWNPGARSGSSCPDRQALGPA